MTFFKKNILTYGPYGVCLENNDLCFPLLVIQSVWFCEKIPDYLQQDLNRDTITSNEIKFKTSWKATKIFFVKYFNQDYWQILQIT